MMPPSPGRTGACGGVIGATALTGPFPALAERRATCRCWPREWPGNVRELKAVVESAGALILPDQRDVDADLLRLAAGDASPDTAAPAAGAVDTSAGPLDAARNELALRLVRDAMAPAGGNQSAAARRLGVSRVGLIKKLTRLGLR
jgi:DNA-binding NtrC family response regulator